MSSEISLETPRWDEFPGWLTAVMALPMTDEQLIWCHNAYGSSDAMSFTGDIVEDDDGYYGGLTDRDQIEMMGVNPDTTPVDAFIKAGFGLGVTYA